MLFNELKANKGCETFNMIVIADRGNRVMTSPDGISWTSRNSVADNRWRSVVWGGPAGHELFVAVAESASSYGVMTSPDGINWTGQNAGTNLNLKTITWGGRPGEEIFVALDQADEGIGNNSITSPDGIHWTTRSVGISSIEWHDITWGGPLGRELFVAVANRNITVGPTLMYSSDGINWNFMYDINERFKSLTWGGPTGQERFVAVGHNQLHMLSSFDGITWIRMTMGMDSLPKMSRWIPMEMATLQMPLMQMGMALLIIWTTTITWPQPRWPLIWRSTTPCRLMEMDTTMC